MVKTENKMAKIDKNSILNTIRLLLY